MRRQEDGPDPEDLAEEEAIKSGPGSSLGTGAFLLAGTWPGQRGGNVNDFNEISGRDRARAASMGFLSVALSV
jgi:hypothetical protein